MLVYEFRPFLSIAFKRLERERTIGEEGFIKTKGIDYWFTSQEIDSSSCNILRLQLVCCKIESLPKVFIRMTLTKVNRIYYHIGTMIKQHHNEPPILLQ